MTGSSVAPGDRYAARKANDGYGASIWILPRRDLGPVAEHPLPVFETSRDANVLSIRLRREQDIALVCVGNGLASTYANYHNWGRVRTLRVWKTDQGDTQTTVLGSLGQDDSPNAQVAARNMGRSAELHIELVNAYGGQTIESYDPDVCLTPERRQAFMADHAGMAGQPRYEPGSIMAPDRKAGLSEVFLYTREE